MAADTKRLQPAEFRASGMTSMQDFLNLSLERQVVGITIELVLMGLVLGMIGAYGAAERRPARQALADEHIR